jgi:hypothetical protein
MVIMSIFDTRGKGKQNPTKNNMRVNDRSYGSGAHLLIPGQKGNQKPMTHSEREGEETNLKKQKKRFGKLWCFCPPFMPILRGIYSQLMRKFGGKGIMDLVATFAGWCGGGGRD